MFSPVSVILSTMGWADMSGPRSVLRVGVFTWSMVPSVVGLPVRVYLGVGIPGVGKPKWVYQRRWGYTRGWVYQGIC